MSDNMEQHLESAVQDMGDLISKSKRVESALGAKKINGHDDDKVVHATVNGRGEIVDIEIDGSALTYPEHLGRRITIAVMRARKTAKTFIEKAQAKYLPELPTASTPENINEPSQSPIDFHAIDFYGPVEA